MSNEQQPCTCGGSGFPDKACKACLQKWKTEHEREIEALEERLDDYRISLDEIEFYLNEEEEEDGDND